MLFRSRFVSPAWILRRGKILNYDLFVDGLRDESQSEECAPVLLKN